MCFLAYGRRRTGCQSESGGWSISVWSDRLEAYLCTYSKQSVCLQGRSVPADGPRRAGAIRRGTSRSRSVHHLLLGSETRATNTPLPSIRPFTAGFTSCSCTYQQHACACVGFPGVRFPTSNPHTVCGLALKNTSWASPHGAKPHAPRRPERCVSTQTAGFLSFEMSEGAEMSLFMYLFIVKRD